jgi:hypothetical protein
MKLNQNEYTNISYSLFISSMFYLFILCFFSINWCCCCNNSNDLADLNGTKIDYEKYDGLILGDIQKDRKNYILFIFNIFYFNLINI